MTVFCDGENPTYPAWRLHVSMARDRFNYDYVSQNWVAAPSPPDATDRKSAFAWQLARKG